MKHFTDEELEKAIELSNEIQEIIQTYRTFSGECGKKLLEICDFLNDEDLKNEIQNGNPFFPSFVSNELIEKVMQELCTHIGNEDLEYVNEYTNGALYQYYNEDIKKEVFSNIAETLIEQLESGDKTEKYYAPDRISNLFKYSSEEIQKNNINLLLEFMDIYIEQYNYYESEKLLKYISPNVQSKIFVVLFNKIEEKLEQVKEDFTQIENGGVKVKSGLELLKIVKSISGLERMPTIFMD